MRYEIEPYVGALPLRFGMPPDTVREIAGATRFSKKKPGSLREIYVGGAACTFEGAPDRLALVEVGFAKDIGPALVYRGTALFEGPRRAVLRRLIGDDAEVKEIAGFLVFLKLGIAMIGFHDGHEEDLAVTVFERGRWDAEILKMKAYKLE